MPLLNVQTALDVYKEQQALEEQQRQIADTVIPPPDIDSLSAYIRSDWEKAYRAKQSIEAKMIAHIRAFKSEYPPEKKAKIQQLNSSLYYVPLTNMKCRAASAWLKEILLPVNERIWSLNPTPVPELPAEVVDELNQDMANEYATAIQNIQMMGAPPEVMPKIAKEIKSSLDDKYEAKLKSEAKEAAEEMEDKIDDQLVEGGFYDALQQIIEEIAMFPSVFIKGPVFRKEKRYKRQQDSMTGTWSSEVETRILPMYERCSPFDIYPAPESSHVNDGYLFHKISFYPKDLYDLIGVEGFSEKEIRLVLGECASGSLRDWTTYSHERQAIENKSSTIGDSEKIDCLEYWGSIRGELLMDWGLGEQDGVVDKDDYYDICAWLINNHVIKAMLNPDPLGKKPFSMASIITVPDSFWGIDLVEILEPIQTSINAIGRAIINNAAIASGPLIERNIDRLPANEPKMIYPFKIFDSYDSAINNSPAYRFYAPPMVADRLWATYEGLLKQADEYSGIPAYAHGDVTVGGAGRTASGLKMLTNNANRGVKNIVRNIDKGIIETIIERQYYYNIEMGLVGDEIPDLRVVAKGTRAIEEKEIQGVRMTEFLQATNNPVDVQIIGMAGRRILLQKVAKANGIDFEIPEEYDPANAVLQPPLPSGGSPPAPMPLDGAGNPVSGQDVNTNKADNG